MAAWLARICDFVLMETSIPRPRAPRRKTRERMRSNGRLPRKGTPKTVVPTSTERTTSMKPIPT
jgi:hypothetical protein